MQTLLSNFIYDQSFDTGLLQVPFPTGSGKSYQTYEFFVRAMTNPDDTNHYIFITDQKKNLNDEDLRDRFKKAGCEDALDQNFLFIKSNIDCICDNWDLVEDQIPDEETKEKEAIQKVKVALKDYRKYKDVDLNVAAVYEKILGDAERAFRKYFLEKLDKEAENAIPQQETKKKRQDVVYKKKRELLNTKKWSWLAILYPVLLLPEKRLVFVNMSKFLSLYISLIGDGKLLYESKYMQNNDAYKTVLFIDEFDATKNTILIFLRNQAMNNNLDVLKAVRHIVMYLTNKTLPDRFINDKSIERTHKRALHEVEQIVEKYNLTYNFKFDEGEEDLHMFQSRDRSIITSDKQKIEVRSNDKEKMNQILCMTEVKAEKKRDEDIHALMKHSMRLFHRFVALIQAIAVWNYKNKKQDTDMEKGDFYTQADLKTALSQFDIEISDALGKYVRDKLIAYHTKRKNYMVDEASFYENGYLYYYIENSSDHEHQSVVRTYHLKPTPEKIMINICEHAKVVGLSATISYESTIKNYNLEYLKANLGAGYKRYDADKEAYEEAKQLVESRLGDAGKVQYHVSFTKYMKDGQEILTNNRKKKIQKEDWENLVGDKELGKALWGAIQDKPVEEEKKAYIYARYYRIAMAISDFFNRDVHSYLCFTSRLPGDYDDFHSEVIQKLFNRFKDYTYGDEDKKNQVSLEVLRSGPGYGKKLEDIKERLHQGEHIFLMTSYGTGAVGQNFQYKAAKDDQCVAVRDDGEVFIPEESERDFEAIYLDCPTNIIAAKELGDKLNAFYYIESMYETGSISPANRVELIKLCANAVGKNAPKFQHRVYQNADARIAIQTTINQAIGRMCRTGFKNEYTTILLDAELINKMAIKIPDRAMENYAFLAVCDAIKKRKKEEEPSEEMENQLQRAQQNIHHMIHTILSRGFSEEGDIKRWNALREFFVKYPVAAITDHPCVQKYYVKDDKKRGYYYYEKTGDFEAVTLSDHGDAMVSEEKSRLPVLMKIPEVREYFLKHGYATSWDYSKKYLLSPMAFQNIYKGAIGEYAVRAILEHNGYHLEDIKEPEQFEKFDFLLKENGKTVAIDAKNWSEYTKNENEVEWNTIAKKAKYVGCQYVLIINILGDDRHDIKHKREIDGVQIMTIPNLYDVGSDGAVTINVEKLVEMRGFIHE